MISATVGNSISGARPAMCMSPSLLAGFGRGCALSTVYVAVMVALLRYFSMKEFFNVISISAWMVAAERRRRINDAAVKQREREKYWRVINEIPSREPMMTRLRNNAE